MSNTTQMPCPKCGYTYTKAGSSNRARDGQSVRRKRVCVKCGHGFVCYEVRASEYAMLQALRKWRGEASNVSE